MGNENLEFRIEKMRKRGFRDDGNNSEKKISKTDYLTLGGGCNGKEKGGNDEKI